MTDLHPLGVTPRFLWVEHRMDDLWQAIMRYIKAGQLPSQEWLDEYKEHEEWLETRAFVSALFDTGEKNED